MNLKLLRSALCLLSLSALFVEGTLAQPGGTSEIRAKFAQDYNAGKYRDAIADAAALQKLNALDPQTALVTAQAYYKAGDLAGCSKYIRENPYLSKDPIIDGEHPAAELLDRCEQLWPQP
jgi:hypothetical protein